jgi:hypothetical protein
MVPLRDGIAIDAGLRVKRRRLVDHPWRLAQQKHSLRCDPALIKAIARGQELATGHSRSLQELAKRDSISRRYIRRLVGLAFLSPQLVEAILQGRQSVELTATRLTELDLPLDWTESHVCKSRRSPPRACAFGRSRSHTCASRRG